MRRKIYLVIVFCIVYIFIFFLLYHLTKKEYIQILEDRWNICLPTPISEIYNVNDNVSPLGDGEYYTIFQYSEKQYQELLQSIEWEMYKNVDIEIKIQSILENMKIDETYNVDFEKKYLYYFKKKDDNSKLYIIWSEDNMLIYVLEDIL